MSGNKIIIFPILIFWFGELYAQGIPTCSGPLNSGQYRSSSNSPISISEAGEQKSPNPLAIQNYSAVNPKHSKLIKGNNLFSGERISPKENYKAVVKLINVSLPNRDGISSPKFACKILAGFNSPSYGFKPVLSMAGNFDLKVDSQYSGVGANGKLTLAYNLRHPLNQKKTYFGLEIQRIAFKMSIPFRI